MTLRNSVKTGTDPKAVAVQIDPELVNLCFTVDYRQFFQWLDLEVELIIGKRNSGMAIAVANVLEVSPADWLKERL